MFSTRVGLSLAMPLACLFFTACSPISSRISVDDFTATSLTEDWKHSEAIQEWNRIEEQDPDYPRLHEQRGSNYFYVERYKEAAEDFSRGLSLHDKGEIRLMRGLAYSAMGEFDLARADFDSLLTKNPNDMLARQYRGVNYARQGKYQEALDDFQTCLANGPNALVYNDMGAVYSKMGKYDDAIKAFDSALKCRDSNDLFANTAYIGRGLLYRKTGKYSESARDLTRWIDLSADSDAIPPESDAARFDKHYTGRAHYYRALVYKHLGKADLSEADKREAEKLSYAPGPAAEFIEFVDE